MLRIFFISISFLVPLNIIAQHIIINEVQYTNQETIYDADGDTPDWVELYNAGAETVNLKGYGVTDDSTDSERWLFPELQLNSGEFVLVFLSSKNRDTTDELHADFKIHIMHDPLFLYDPEGNIIDKISPVCVPADNSLGYKTDGVGVRQVLTPTPGYSNKSADIITVNYHYDSLMVNLASGFYSDKAEIELTNLLPDNKIVYTLDGEVPDDSSDIYHTKLTLEDISDQENRFANKTDYDFEDKNLISKANILRARVYSGGCPASNEISNTYFVDINNEQNYKVPIVSLITEEDNLFDDDEGIYVAGNQVNYNQKGKKWERPAHIEIFDSTGIQIIDQDIGIRIHGRGSRGAPQKSLRLYAREEYGKASFDYPLLDQKPNIGSYKTMLLRATRDWSGTVFKDELGQHIVQDMNIDYTAANTVVVFINGEYWGIHSLRERHDAYYVENNYGFDNPELNIIAHNIDSVAVEEGPIDAYDELISFLELSDPESSDFYQDVSERIDLKNFMDYYIAQLYLANVDFPYNNFEMWRVNSDTAHWRFFFFDLDGAMSRANYNHLMEYTNEYDDFSRYPEYSTFILRQLLQNQQFRREFNARYTYHLSTTFSADRVLDLIDSYQEKYEALIGEHIYRWNMPSDYTKWLNNIDMLRQFAIQRPLYAQEQLTESFGNPFTIYPNPGNGNFYLDFDEEQADAGLTIVNLQGVPVYSANASGSSMPFNLYCPPGMYIAKVVIGEWIYTERIIIQ